MQLLWQGISRRRDCLHGRPPTTYRRHRPAETKSPRPVGVQASKTGAHDAPSFAALVPGMHFRTDAVVVRDHRHLADAGNPRRQMDGRVVFHSHGAWHEVRTKFKQPSAKDICGPDGAGIYRNHHSRHHDGGELRAESSHGVLLPRVRNRIPAAVDFDSFDFLDGRLSSCWRFRPLLF